MILHITMLIGAHNVEIQSVFNMERILNIIINKILMD